MIDEFLGGVARGAAELVELAIGRRRHHQRPVLGADGVIGRHHAGLAVARDLGAVDEIQDRGTGAEIEDQPAPGAVDFFVLQRAGAAQDRGDLGERSGCLRQLRGDEHRLAVFLQAFLGERHHLDHALIGLPRIVAEGEDAVLVEDQALDLGIACRKRRPLLFASPKPGMM